MITPIVRIFDEERAKDFYLNFLGFQLDWEHRFAEGMPLYFQISSGENTIHLSEHHGDCCPGATIRIEVENIAELHRKLLSKNYKHARPGLEATPWGTEEMSIIDPFGNRIVYYQNRVSHFPALETERIHLVRVGPEHAKPLFDIFRLEEVTRYYGMSSFSSVEQAAKMIESFHNNFQENRAIRWGMVLKSTGEFIGTVGLNNLQRWSKRAEIGYDAHPAFWRGGYTSEAVREMLRYSFEELDLYRLAAITFPQNDASAGLLNKLGFQKEGVLRGYLYQNQKHHDAAVYSLLRLDWGENI